MTVSDDESIQSSAVSRSSLTRSPSINTSLPDLQISINTPLTIKSNLDSAQIRAAKRKAACEFQSDNKELKITDAATPANRGGRPKKESSGQPRQPSGPLKLYKSRPVKAYLPPEIWQNILEHSSPAVLRRARLLNRNFYDSLTTSNKFPLWRRARKFAYGADHPDPPSDINEIQYADLLDGQGCHSCLNTKTRKTYWAFLRRWCEPCLQKKVVTEMEAEAIMHPYLDYRECVPQAIRDSWNHYQYIDPSSRPKPGWAKHQKHGHTVYLKSGPEGLEALKARIDAFNRSTADGTSRTSDEIAEFLANARVEMVMKLDQRRKVEDWEGLARNRHKIQAKAISDGRRKSIEERAMKMTPPIEQACLENLTAFKNAMQIPRPLTDRSWRELEPKLFGEMQELRDRAAFEEAKAKEKQEERVANYRMLFGLSEPAALRTSLPLPATASFNFDHEIDPTCNFQSQNSNGYGLLSDLNHATRANGTVNGPLASSIHRQLPPPHTAYSNAFSNGPISFLNNIGTDPYQSNSSSFHFRRR